MLAYYFKTIIKGTQLMKKTTPNYAIEMINNESINSLISSSEICYKNQLTELVEEVINNNNIHFILLSGPSSSGKTTSSHIIKELIEQHKKHATVISLDDFFLEREETPVLPNGDKDFDSVNSIDWALFDKCMSELQEKGSSTLPVYNFLTGKKEFNHPATTLKENEIIILEGLHALNPIINNFIAKKSSYKVYVCPKSEFTLDNNIVLDIFQLRLIRRLIRDVRTRGIEPSQTLYFWKNVRAAEDLYVIPFEKEADYVVNTTHAYEPCVYKSILSVVLKNHSQVVQHLLTHLDGFVQIEPSKVPAGSVLKEFVG